MCMLGGFLGNSKLQCIVNYCGLEFADYSYQRQCFVLVCICHKSIQTYKEKIMKDLSESVFTFSNLILECHD